MAAAVENPNTPRVIGRYVLYGAIASGGMATVHFGRLVGPAGFARPVAIKRLHGQYAQDPEFLSMFTDEARLAARISHPNVVQTIDLVEAPNEFLIVMEYVRGLSLASLLRTLRRHKQRVPPAVAVGIMIGVLEGLHAAHEAKNDMGDRLDLVHRDVSPQNVLVGTDGTARLIDFGVAKATNQSQSTRDGKVKGKIAYLAPEQIQGEQVTRRTDVYSAAVLLWEILTGRRLFLGESDADTLRKATYDEVPKPSSIFGDLPPSLDDIVLRGLQRDASKRYTTAHEMAVVLAQQVPAASTAEIGAWVEQTAAEELRQRESRIAAIERSAAESMSHVTRVASIPGAGAPDAPTPVGRRMSEVATVAAVVTTSAALRQGSRRVLLLAVAAACLGVLAVVFCIPIVRARSAAAVVIHPSTSALPVARTSATPPHPAPPIPALDPPAESSPEETAAQAPSASAEAPQPPKAAPKSSTAAPSRCDPPYTEDSQGHIHFKPSCM